MIKITAAVAALALILLVAGVTRSALVKMQPQGSAAVTEAGAAVNRPAVSPFEIMTNKGRNLPTEDWGPAF